MKVPWRKLRLLFADLGRVNSRYWSDTGQRNRMREVLKRDGLTPAQHAVMAAEEAAAPPESRPYVGLDGTSLTLAGIRLVPGVPASLNLVIGEVREGGVFAGIHTALTVGVALAHRLGLPLRVVMTDFTSPGNDRASAERFIRATFGLSTVVVVTRESLREHEFSPADVWLATHWKTAHAVQVATTTALIDPARVVYLVQDYEPGFSPWSTESVLARSTYHAGFTFLVNSVPLWSYLCREESLSIPREQVFGPSFEVDRLRATAARRRPSTEVTVLFYARPSKHRNLFQVGVAALRVSVRDLAADAPPLRFYSAGEPHDAIDLGGGHMLTSLGRMPWGDYFDFLSRTQVLLSLQQSPHPSHPPFDAAISGGLAVTNEFHGTRVGLHPRIAAVEASPAALGAALVSAIAAASGAPAAWYLPVANGLLGAELGSAVEAVVVSLEMA